MFQINAPFKRGVFILKILKRGGVYSRGGGCLIEVIR